MAVNFGDTILEGGIEPAAKVQKPVQDDSGAVLANAMAPVAAGIGEMLGGIFKGQQENSDNLILNRFEEELSTLADAVEQGQLDPTNVMSHARHIRAKYLSNAPNLRDKLDGAWTHFANATGVGHVLIQGTPEQQADQALTKAAVAAGYDNVDQYKRVLASENELKRIENDVKYLQAQGNLVTENQKNQFIQTATSLANNAYPAARNVINRAMAAMDAASTPTERAAIAQQVTAEIRTNVADMKNITGGVGAEYITAPIEDLLKLVDDYAKGTVTTEVLKGTIATTQATMEAMAMTTPSLAEWITKSKMLKEAGYNETQIHAEMLKIPGNIEIFRNFLETDLSGDILNNSSDTNQFAATTTKILGSTAMSNNPEVVEEVRTMLNGIVDDSYNLERIAKDGALGWKPVVTILGSPEAAEWVRKNGPISATNKAALSEVIGKHYTAELLPTIRSFWDESTIPTPGMQDGVRFAQPTNIKANDALEPVWNGSVVEFVPKAGFENNPSVRAMADEMNMGSNSIGIPLNDIIRADALLTGQDAKTVWEERFARQLFNAEPPSISDRVNETLDRTGDPSYTPEEDTELTLSDFNPTPIESNLDIADVDTSSFQPLDSGSFIEPTSNPAVDKQVLDKFAGRRLPVSIRNNNMGAVSITGNIDNSWAAKQPGFVGTTPRPANEGGYYAKYATPEHGVAAASKLLELYGRQGVDSPAAIVRKWSADRAAHTSYANTLVKYLKEAGIEASSSTPIDLSDPKVRMAVLKAKSSHEAGAGRPVYNDQTFLRGVTYQL
jgi:hypothetical protein